MDGVVLRKFAPSDEDAVRRLCLTTAFDETSRRSFADDARLVTETLIGYHIRYEPSRFWVAESGSAIAGYLAGVEDTQHYERTFLAKIAPLVIVRWILRTRFLRRRGWSLVLSGVRHASAWRAAKHLATPEYPAHFHINMAPECRGRGIGTELVRLFLDQLRVRQVAGVHVTTHGEQARHFFDRSGFRVFASVSLPTPFARSKTIGWLMVMPIRGQGA
jgi:ribosomal protein S18 acetylase RimI-like enzyme